MTYIYDSNGQYRGHTSTVGPQHMAQARTMAPLIIFGSIGWWLWGILNHWQTLEIPYKYVAQFYYYLIVVPIKTIPPVWAFCSSITGYPNLNLVIGCILILMYFIFGLGLYVGMLGLVFRTLGLGKHIWGILMSPALLALIWFVSFSAYSWLTQK